MFMVLKIIDYLLAFMIFWWCNVTFTLCEH